MTTIPRRRSALAALVAIPTALVIVLSGCASGSVGGGETQAPATDDRFASIIPDGDIVQFSKDLVAGSLNATEGFTPPSEGPTTTRRHPPGYVSSWRTVNPRASTKNVNASSWSWTRKVTSRSRIIRRA